MTAAFGFTGSCWHWLYSNIGCSILANSLGCVAQGLPTIIYLPDTLAPDRVALGPDGNLYVSGWGFGPPLGQIVKVTLNN